MTTTLMTKTTAVAVVAAAAAATTTTTATTTATTTTAAVVAAVAAATATTTTTTTTKGWLGQSDAYNNGIGGGQHDYSYGGGQHYIKYILGLQAPKSSHGNNDHTSVPTWTECTGQMWTQADVDSVCTVSPR